MVISIQKSENQPSIICSKLTMQTLEQDVKCLKLTIKTTERRQWQ